MSKDEPKAGERVTKARRKAQAEGRRRLASFLSAEGSERYIRLRGNYRTEAALIEAGLKALEGSNSLTDEELLNMVAMRMKSERMERKQPETQKEPNSVKENPMRSVIPTPARRT